MGAKEIKKKKTNPVAKPKKKTAGVAKKRAPATLHRAAAKPAKKPRVLKAAARPAAAKTALSKRPGIAKPARKPAAKKVAPQRAIVPQTRETRALAQTPEAPVIQVRTLPETYSPADIEPKWQKAWDAGVVPGGDRPDEEKILRPYHAALFQRRSAHRPLVCDDALRCAGPLHADAGLQRACSRLGFDAFGLPAENAAIKRGIHPKKWTYSNIDHMRGQLRAMGAMFDWAREAVSADPEYYRWTQWFFVQLFQARAGLQENVAGRLVPQLQYDPGPRTGVGRRPPLRTLRNAGDQEEPGSVVLPADQVRRGAAGFLRH